MKNGFHHLLVITDRSSRERGHHRITDRKGVSSFPCRPHTSTPAPPSSASGGGGGFAPSGQSWPWSRSPPLSAHATTRQRPRPRRRCGRCRCSAWHLSPRTRIVSLPAWYGRAT